MKNLKVILVAHEFSPILGSECREGWIVANALSAHSEITVFCASGNQKEWFNYRIQIEEYCKSNNIKKLPFNIIYIDQPLIGKLLSRLNFALFKGSTGNPFFYWLCYRFWHFKLFKYLEKNSLYRDFDVIHLLTSISYREPGYLYRLNMPMVWGPTGGLTILPLSFYSRLSLKTRVKEILHRFSSRISLIASYRIIKTVSKCQHIYAFSKVDYNFFIKYCHSVTLLSDSFTVNTAHPKVNNSINTTLNLLWVGQLVERKQLVIIIRALDLLPLSLKDKLRLTVLGDGPQLLQMKRLVNDLGMSEIINFRGHVSSDSVTHEMINSNLLIHTSYREAGANVIGQALSCGLPIICHDICGMALIVNDECGFKIPLINQDYSIRSISERISYLYFNPEVLEKLHDGAIKRSLELSVEEITKKFPQIYFNSIKSFKNNQL